MTDTPLKIGFIGLGIMGAPMAAHLIAAGHQLFVHTHGKLVAEIAESSATVCTHAQGVAERADIVLHHGAGHARRGRGAVRPERASPRACAPARRWST